MTRQRSTRHPRRTIRRRGMASMLAMLFLILFSVLAVGFYASANMSAQVARNEGVAADSQLAAESGLAFMRYQLGAIDIPVSTPNENLLTTVKGQLATLLDGTANMGGSTVQISDGAIHIPSAAGWMSLN